MCIDEEKKLFRVYCFVEAENIDLAWEDFKENQEAYTFNIEELDN